MNSQILPWFPINSLISLINLSLFVQFPLSLSLSYPDESFYQSCNRPFSCGSITGLDYPFRGVEEPEHCGYPGLVLNCHNNIATIDMKKVTYRVLDVNDAAQTMKIAREDMMEAACPQNLANTTLDSALFEYSSIHKDLTFLYGCEAPELGLIPIPFCKVPGYDSVYLLSDPGEYSLPGTEGSYSCKVSVTVPVGNWVWSVNLTDLKQSLQGELEVTIRWKVDSRACSKCTLSGGRCGYSYVTNQTTCYCPSQPFVAKTCSATVRAASTAVAPSTSTSPGKLLKIFWAK